MKNGNHILHYDLNDLRYSGYFVNGFYEAAADGNFTFSKSRTVPLLLKEAGMEGWQDILFSICLFKANLFGEEFYFCIDTRDSNNTAAGKGYHLPLLEKVRYYFKVNYHPEAIRTDRYLQPFAAKIIPAHPFFEVRPSRWGACIPRLLPAPSAGWTVGKAFQHLRIFGRLPSIDAIRRRRSFVKNVDIFFVVRFYDPAKHPAENEFRYQIMQAIRQVPGITSRIGFASPKPLPGKYAAFRVSPIPLEEYLDGLARSRVAIYVRGLHDCLSFKFGQLLALGLPIAGQTLANNTENLLGLGRLREQFSHQDPQAIVQAAAGLLENTGRREELATANASTFDVSLTPREVVSDILETLFTAEKP